MVNLTKNACIDRVRHEVEGKSFTSGIPAAFSSVAEANPFSPGIERKYFVVICFLG